MLLPDDQQAQRRRDMRAMERRLDDLDGEERREIAAIADRYAEIKPAHHRGRRGVRADAAGRGREGWR